MAYAYTIPDDMLAPGDLLDVDFLVTSDNDTLVGMAIQDVKKALWADPRFDYQGSAWQTREDGRHLIVTVSVRTTLKGETVPIQQANVAVGLIAVATAITLLAGAIAYWSCMEYKGAVLKAGVERARIEQIERIRNDPTLSPEEKTAQIAAVPSAPETGLGAGVAAFGGSLVTAVIVIGVLWALSLGVRHRGSE
jgi:hypothetical protein